MSVRPLYLVCWWTSRCEWANSLVDERVSRFLHLALEDSSHEGHTTAATRSGLGLALDLSELGHSIFDTAGDGPLGYVLASSAGLDRVWGFFFYTGACSVHLRGTSR